ncbi:hypothetical protein BJX70DRAFT_401819 [Aspergillus crustosus]
MFIPYTGLSKKKEPGARSTINAYVAANANLKRRRRGEKAGEDGGEQSNQMEVSMQWLHERPVIISRHSPPQAPPALTPEMTPEVVADEEIIPKEAAIQLPLNNGVVYPVPKKPYYPALLFQRENIFLRVAHQYPKTFSHMIYTEWTQTVLSNPLFFHATMYATSAFMDMMHRRQDNPTTLRHKFETIRMIRDSVSRAPVDGLPAETIGITTYLVYFECLGGNFVEASRHNAGIDAMLQFKGAGSISRDTYTSYLLNIRNVWNSIVAQADTLERPTHLRLPVSVLNLLITFNAQCIQNPTRLLQLYIDFPLPEPVGGEIEIDVQDPHIINSQQCISAAATLYWAAITRDQPQYQQTTNAHTPFNKTNYTQALQTLKSSIAQSDTLFWLRIGPEVLRWIMMTGAVAAASLPDQAFFILRSYMLTTIVEPGEMESFLLGADHLLWVFNRLVPD